jgi:hypothetical protein
MRVQLHCIARIHVVHQDSHRCFLAERSPTDGFFYLLVDFLVHHIYAFTIHVTVLILLKCVLFARSSQLIIKKSYFKKVSNYFAIVFFFFSFFDESLI